MIKLNGFREYRHFWPVILLLLISSLAVWSLLQPGYFYHHDDLQIMRIYQIDKCIKDGQIPCRWVPDMGYGYGYPLFNYYPVVPYYLGELIHSLSFSLIWSVKIDFILSLIVSALTMYLLAQALWGRLGGIVSAVFYLLAPYHAVDVYVRGAMAESWSIAWVPAVFWAVYKVIIEGGMKNIIFLAVFTSLFLTSHNPLALIFVPVIGGWTILLVILYKKWSILPMLVLGAFWGLGLAAFFTLPVIFESQLVHVETLVLGYFNYLAHFISLYQMFISTFWGYGGSIWGPNDTMSLQIGWLHWGGVILSLPVAVLLWKKNRAKGLVLIYLFLVFWFAAFLIHPRSNFIWERLSLLQNIQFPWRILSVVIMVSSFSVGSLLVLSGRKILRYALFTTLLLGAVVLYQGYFRIEKPIPLTDEEKLSGALWDLQRTAGIFDYLPKTAKFPPGGPALETAEVLTGDVKVYEFQRGTNWLSFTAESSAGAKLRLPIIDFPQWKVFVNNKEIQFDNQNELGQPTFDIGMGAHKVFAKLYNTPVRTAANIVSVAAFVLLIFSLQGLWKKN